MSTPINKSNSSEPSQTARILESVELLLALHQNQGNQQSGSQPQNSDRDQLQAELHEALEQQLDAGFTALSEQLASPGLTQQESGPSPEKSFNKELNEKLDQWRSELKSSLGERIAASLESHCQPSSDRVDFTSGQSLVRLTEHVDRGMEKLTETLEGLLGMRLEDLAGRFEKLEKQTGAVQSQLTNLETQAVFGVKSSDDSSAPPAELMSRLDEKLERSTRSLLSDVELHLNELYDRLASQLNPKQPIAEENLNPQVAPSDDDSASHWEKQKRAMLQKYGIDPEKRPLEEDKKREQPVKRISESAADKLNALHNSIANISPEDNAAIEKLKQELNSKLRDAEVEISINRAKLSQERAELDQQRSELEQRMADLDAKLASRDSNPVDKKGGFMGRFSRHLGK